MEVLLTCEHATNHVPAEYAHLFVGAQTILASHRGWDPGSLALGRTLQRKLSADLFRTTVTRLLIEVNRSPRHQRLFSEFSRSLDADAQQKVLARYYLPHRDAVQTWIDQRTQAGRCVLHLSLHTFVPQLGDQVRNADIGLLYDPRRALEKRFCDRWDAELHTLRPDLRIRRNYPYLGRADGFTTALRRRYPDLLYVGIELEVNQSWVVQGSPWRQLKRDIAESLALMIPAAD